MDYSVRAFRSFSFSFLLVGFNIVTSGFMTALERPLPAIAISAGRGLVVQGAVLLLIASLFGGDAIWYTPVFSELLCLCFSICLLRRCLRGTPPPSA